MTYEESLQLLYPYQRFAFEAAKDKKGFLNFDDMGLGKTMTTLLSAEYKVRKYKNRDKVRILILAPQKAFGVWQGEISSWLSKNSIIYHGTATQRKKLKVQLHEEQVEYVITSYGMAKEFYGESFDVLIADEIHDAGLLNYKTKTFKSICELRKTIEFMFLLTGSPVRKGCIDLYGPLHLIAPERFKSYWGFVNKFCHTIQTMYGKEIQPNPRDIPMFRAMLTNYMCRRLKGEVLEDLPGKQRQVIPIDMTTKQKEIHDKLLEEFLYENLVDDELIIVENKMQAILRLRQLLVSPRLLDIDDDGALMEYLRDEAHSVLGSGKSMVIFTPFRGALPIIANVIKQVSPSTAIYQLSGGMSPEEFYHTWKGFQDNPSNNKVEICVIKSGASFHATSADICYFFGYEWDFNLNAQAEDRLYRIGQKNFVNCYYPLHNGNSIDNLVKDKLNNKQVASNFIIGSDDLYRTMMAELTKYKNR